MVVASTRKGVLLFAEHVLPMLFCRRVASDLGRELEIRAHTQGLTGKVIDGILATDLSFLSAN